MTRSCRASSTRYSPTTGPRSPRPPSPAGRHRADRALDQPDPVPAPGRPGHAAERLEYFTTQPRFAYLPKALREIERIWISQLELGKQAGLFRADLDAKLTYRLMRDVLWIPAQWRRTGGYTTEQVVDGFLRILFDGIAAGGPVHRRPERPSLQPGGRLLPSDQASVWSRRPGGPWAGSTARSR